MNDNTQIRVGHFSPDAPAVNVMVDGQTVLEGVSFQTLSDYMTIDAGQIDVAVAPADGGDAVIEATVDVAEGDELTVLATGELSNVEALVFSDTNTSISGDRARVRFVHTSPDAPAVDLSVVDGPTLFSGIEFGEASNYTTVDAGDYRIRVVPSGSDDSVLDLDLTLEAGGTYTAFAAGTVADGTLTAVLAEDVLSKTAAKK
jgi:hypothetical protein